MTADDVPAMLRECSPEMCKICVGRSECNDMMKHYLALISDYVNSPEYTPGSDE